MPPYDGRRKRNTYFGAAQSAGSSHGLIMRRRPVVIATVILLATLAVISLGDSIVDGGIVSVWNNRAVADVTASWKRDPCRDWDPYAPEASDNPQCLRAQQFRQIARFTSSKEYAALGDIGQQQAINRAMLCTLGSASCPPRPLIVTDWEFLYNTEHKSGIAHGEEVWIAPIVEGIRQLGYELLIFDKDEDRTWNYTRLLDKSIHMYLTDANQVFRCFHNPRCVRPEDYVEPATHAITVSPEERGVLPAWRIFGLNYWGARPNRYNAIFLDAAQHWGMGDEEWSHHVLGTKWQIVPYKYPGHTNIPLTIEHACLQNTVVPHEERADSVLILAKIRGYLWGHRIKGIHPAWSDIVTHMKDFGIEFWLTARTDGDFPDGMVSLGPLPPKAYIQRTSMAKAMLGIGMPSISPSAYEALCAGVPVLMPKSGNHSATGWDMFHPDWFQHGPLQALDPPYVYSYDSNDPIDLEEKLKAAVSTPIGSFIPPDMTIAAVFARIKQVMEHDWETEYHAVRAANGGRNPGYKPIMWEKCWERGVCDPSVLSHRP